MVRLDMSEYMEKFTASRLVGSPPGYVGYDEGGQLTEAVRRRPYSVVLFDEIEKAHPDVFNMLLQILDDGRLTDSKGRTVDFKNTRHHHDQQRRQQPDPAARARASARGNGDARRHEELEKRLLDELRKTFRPEFLNRVDEIIVFDPLTRSSSSRSSICCSTHVRELVEGQGMRLEVSEAAKALHRRRRATTSQYGARPLRRAIQRLLENPLSSELLRGRFHEGETIKVDAADGALVFEKA